MTTQKWYVVRQNGDRLTGASFDKEQHFVASAAAVAATVRFLNGRRGPSKNI